MRNTLISLGVVQNMGWLDRVAHFVLGTLMMAGPIVLMSTNQLEPAWYLYVSMLLAVAPITFSIFGLEPIYSIFNVKSCGTSNRNQCGTFPYEVDAALGRNPKPESIREHSLELSRH